MSCHSITSSVIHCLLGKILQFGYNLRNQALISANKAQKKQATFLSPRAGIAWYKGVEWTRDHQLPYLFTVFLVTIVPIIKEKSKVKSHYAYRFHLTFYLSLLRYDFSISHCAKKESLSAKSGKYFSLKSCRFFSGFKSVKSSGYKLLAIYSIKT